MEYIIATSGRTGSNYLQRLLRNNGFGDPNEHFHAEIFGFEAAARGGVTTEQWAARMRAEHSSGEIYGVKLMDKTVMLMGKYMKEPRTDGWEVLQSLFPGARYVYLYRENVIRQAISYWRAWESGKWLRWARERGEPEQGPPDLDVEALDRHLRYIRNANRFWRELFASHAIEPLPVTYEQLVADPRGVVTDVAGFLGLELPEQTVVAVDIVPQADGLTDRYELEYRSLLAEREAEREGGP